MLAFSHQSQHNVLMSPREQPALALNIQILPYGDNANLIINGRVYHIYTPVVTSLELLVRLLQEGNEPEYIIYAVIAMLQEMVE